MEFTKKWNWAHASGIVRYVNIVRGVSFRRTILPFQGKLGKNYSIFQLKPIFLIFFDWKAENLNHVEATRDAATNYAVQKPNHFHVFSHPSQKPGSTCTHTCVQCVHKMRPYFIVKRQYSLWMSSSIHTNPYASLNGLWQQSVPNRT